MSSPWKQSRQIRPARRTGRIPSVVSLIRSATRLLARLVRPGWIKGGLKWSKPAPSLVLSACYGAGHEVEVVWGWIYQIGEARARVPLYASEPAAVFRDPASEREILASLGISLNQFTPHVVLHGVDAMRFTTLIVPWIRSRPDVLVDIDGVPPVFRSPPATVDIAGLAHPLGSTALQALLDMGDLRAVA
jgi:hypothetical protein